MVYQDGTSMTSSTPIIRKPLLQLDLINNTILQAPNSATTLSDFNTASLQTLVFEEELKTKFFEMIGNFWHTEEDTLDFFSYYNDGTYMAQRKRQKYDFQSESLYWSEYQFKSSTPEQATQVYNTALALFAVAAKRKTDVALQKTEALDKEINFFESKWIKRSREKQMMLNASDWRVLPDIEDSYEGEKAQWIAWRAKIRSIAVPTPEQYDDKLAFAQTLYNQVYPIDPKNYRTLYPNGMLEDGVTPAPAFMDPDDADQWTNYDDDASSDFLDSRMINKLMYAKQRASGSKRIKREVLDIIKLMQVESIYPDFDSSQFILDD
jgi:hypothetical protein